MNVALPEAFAYHSDALKRAPEEFGRNVRDRLEMGGQITRDDLHQGARRQGANEDGR